ncbi:MAG: hypothetical protein JXB07_14075 [Anaerolineae bacterium]|nr:hypothetical protein [Anaerolineae bacterium]
MNHKLLAVLSALFVAALACGGAPTGTPIPIPTLERSPYDLGRTLYGFFSSPPEISVESVVATYEAISEHGDVVLLQQNIPWKDFVDSANAQPETEAQPSPITDIHNQYVLAHQNGLEVIFVVDPLNGLDRSEFLGLPFGWEASFANPKVRAAFTNYTLRIVREFHPRYLGLGSEINTYADSYPADFPNYQSLYHEVYQLVKAEAPDTQIFVTFQWEELNNLIPGLAQGEPYEPNWGQMEDFEPELDVWVISSYPFVVFGSGADIPEDYYSPLLTRTLKPLAVAEGGFSSRPAGPAPGTPQDQVDYVNAIHDQIDGDRMTFWIYLILTDINLDSYAGVMRQHGRGGDVNTLGMFTSVGLCDIDGTPKPALEVWDGFRNGSD